jgi:hypothetical protein
MPELGVRSTYSQAPFKIYMCDYAGVMATGTAFNYLHNDTNYIITNWHNLAGRDFFTRDHINRQSRTPLWIKVDTGGFRTREEFDAGKFGIYRRRVEIYRDPDAQLDRLWLEHPVLGTEGCDVVAIPTEKPLDEPDFLHNQVNRISVERVPIIPGEVAVVIGFPRGIEVAWSLPLWKSTFIASEPYYDVTIDGKRLRAFFIDGYTREGMSGSPVFARYNGTWDLNHPYAPVDPDAPNFWSRDDIVFGHTAMEFVGVYSGRLKQNEADAALALVWKRELIEEICQAGHDGKV